MSYTDRFTGQGIQPARVPFRQFSFDASLMLQWPALAKDDDYLADIMNAAATAAGLNLLLPDAREGSSGAVTLIKNTGLYTFTVMNAIGGGVTAINPGQAKYIYLTDTSTEAGTWDVTVFGVGVGQLDLANAAGPGLIPLSSRLAIGKTVSEISGDRPIAATDRAQILVWTGGAGMLTLPLTSTLAPFNFEIRNQGSGALTLTTSGGEEVDGSSSLVLNVGESAEVNAGTGNWYTVGRGRATQFNFSLLVKDLTGLPSPVVLSLTEAANTVQQYTGTLVTDVDVVLPSVVQVYYITNSTTGAFNLRFKNAGVGATVSLPQGQSAVMFSDGTNVTNQATSIAGLSSIVFAPGSAGATPVGVGASNTGLYSSGAGEVGVSSAGTQVAAFDADGLRILGTTPRIGVEANAGAASIEIERLAGQEGRIDLKTGADLRWRLAVDGTPEAGSDAGSNLVVQAADDAGAVKFDALTVNRATGAVTVRAVRDLSQVGQVAQFVCDYTATIAGHVLAAGQLLSRTAYADLFAYATAQGLVSEAAWSGGQWGRFSEGDGSTTFRVPDLRAVFLRGLNAGRNVFGQDARTWGTFEDHANASHSHGVNDPGHNHALTQTPHAHGVNDPSHQHGGSTSYNGDHTHNIPAGPGTGVGGKAAVAPSITAGFPTDVAGGHTHTFATDWRGTGISIQATYANIGINAAVSNISIQSSGGSDGRPRNVAYPYFIRY